MTQESAALSAPAREQKLLTIDGRQLVEMAHAALAGIEQNQQEVNALNVFPVPDGDTGTNMLLTMRAAYGRIKDGEEEHAGKVAGELSTGALMGARGNSGVILSQIWRGFAKGLEEKAVFDAGDLATALQLGADTAYKGVMRPVEGTILTVIREAAEEAVDAARKRNDLLFVLERVYERSEQALARTPDLLDVLAQAGVVDAGGKGLVVILEGILRHLQGESFVATAELVAVELPAQARVAPEEGLEFPYDVQFILTGRGMDVPTVRDTIDAMGDSTLVVGDANTIKVHVHVKDPGMPLSYGAALGHLSDVVVENMQMQMEEIIGAAPAMAETETVEPAPVPVQPGQIGVVSVAAGDGLAEIFRSLGAAGIVNGGQSNNPSTEEIYRIVQELPTERVIILPNNKNIILAAEAARDLSNKQVVVVPTRSAPQGISAMLCLDPDGDIDDVFSSMEEATRQVACGEITVATRSVILDGIAVEEGQLIGVADGQLCAAGAEMDSVLPVVLERMNAPDRELVSIYYGQNVSQGEAEQLAAQVEVLYPDLEVEVLSGGQAIYQYVLGAE